MKYFNIDKIDTNSFSGYIESDCFTDLELEQLGFTLPIGSYMINIPFEVTYSAYSDNDYNIYLDDTIIVTVISPLNNDLQISLEQEVDFNVDDTTERITELVGDEIYADWIGGQVDYYYDQMREEQGQ